MDPESPASVTMATRDQKNQFSKMQRWRKEKNGDTDHNKVAPKQNIGGMKIYLLNESSQGIKETTR